MKAKIFTAIAFIAAIIICSCSSNKQENTASEHDVFASSLTTADTTRVISLCNAFLDYLKNNDKDSAFSLLYSLNENGDLVEPSNLDLAKLSNQFTLFPVRDYKIKSLQMGEELDNVCSYSIIFNIDEQGKEDTINFGFCPVRIDGQWYLTIRNASAELPK